MSEWYGLRKRKNKCGVFFAGGPRCKCIRGGNTTDRECLSPGQKAETNRKLAYAKSLVEKNYHTRIAESKA